MVLVLYDSTILNMDNVVSIEAKILSDEEKAKLFSESIKVGTYSDEEKAILASDTGGKAALSVCEVIITIIANTIQFSPANQQFNYKTFTNSYDPAHYSYFSMEIPMSKENWFELIKAIKNEEKVFCIDQCLRMQA